MDSQNRKRVVVTGIGPVTSIGVGNDAFWNGLMSGNHPARSLPESFREHYAPHTGYYVPLPHVAIKDYFPDKQINRIMQHELHFAIIGTKLALEDADLLKEKIDGTFTIDDSDTAVVVVGIGIAGLEQTFRSYGVHIRSDKAQNDRYQRMVIPMLMPNAPAAWITICFGLNGGSHSVNASCASGTSAIGQAYLKIACGMSSVAVCGGVEALVEPSGSILRGFDMLGLLSRAPDGIPQPFSDARSGFFFAEGGGCMFVLEEMESALKRGVDVYAEITDFAENSDGHNIVQIDSAGKQIIRLLKNLAKNGKIDCLNTHGTGTLLNDNTERNSICTVFGNKDMQPLLGATKGLIGHTLGARGAIETAVCLLSMRKSAVHGNRCEIPFPELNINRENLSVKLSRTATLLQSKESPVLTRGRVNMFVNNVEVSSQKAKRLLSFSAETSIEEGIRKTVSWYRENGYL